MILLFNEDLFKNLELITKPTTQSEKDVTISSFDFINFSNNEQELTKSEQTDFILHNFDEEIDEEVIVDDMLEEVYINDVDKELQEENIKREEELQRKVEQIISDANDQAEQIIKKAEADAIEIKNNAYAEGTDEGYKDGYNKAYNENKALMEEETVKFFLQLKDVIDSYENEKNRLISENINELKEIALAISEKVIQVSLKTSGEIIKKMIISSTEKLKTKEWAKIYIAKCDSSIILESNTDFLKSLNHLSEHIKFIVMEDSAPGTCIIELPDQIIDASASTQIENIRGVLKGLGGHGGL